MGPGKKLGARKENWGPGNKIGGPEFLRDPGPQFLHFNHCLYVTACTQDESYLVLILFLSFSSTSTLISGRQVK